METSLDYIKSLDQSTRGAVIQFVFLSAIDLGIKEMRKRVILQAEKGQLLNETDLREFVWVLFENYIRRHGFITVTYHAREEILDCILHLDRALPITDFPFDKYSIHLHGSSVEIKS